MRGFSQRLLPKECLYTIPSSGGVFASIHLPDFMDTEDLIKRLENRGVDVLATDRQFLSSFPKLMEKTVLGCFR